jgi:hypothetical protein
VELAGRVHGAEREKTGAWVQWLSAWKPRPATQSGKRGAEGETTGADRLAPVGRERARERERERKLPLIGGSHLSGGAGAWPG